MKFFKKFLPRYLAFFLIGLFVLLAIEVGGMIYINNVYLAENLNYSEKKIVKSTAPIKYKSVAVESGYKNAECSFDGRYVAYLSGSQLKIADLVSGETIAVNSAAGETVSNFQWLYDRDMLAVAQTSTVSGTTYVKLFSYDVKAKTLTEIRNNNEDQDLKIKLASKTDTVTAIDMSTETVVTYLRITSKDNQSKIYKINSFVGISRMSDMVTTKIGTIKCLKTVEKLLYENSENGRIYPYGSSNSFNISGNRNLKLLAVDSGDTAYFASIKDGKANAISYGNTETRVFSEKSLTKPVDPASIYVTINGNVFVNNTATSNIEKVVLSGTPDSSSSSVASSKASGSSSSKTSSASSGTTLTTTYRGIVVGVTDTGFITVDNNKFVHYNFS